MGSHPKRLCWSFSDAAWGPAHRTAPVPFGCRPVSGGGAFRCGGPRRSRLQRRTGPPEPAAPAARRPGRRPRQLEPQQGQRIGKAQPAAPEQPPAFLQQGQHPAPQQAAHADRRGGKGPGRPGAHAAGRHQGRQSRPTTGRGRRPQCEGGQNRYGCRSPNGICRHKNAPPCTISMRGGALCMPDGFTFCCWKPWRKLRAHCPCSAFPPSRWRSW